MKDSTKSIPGLLKAVLIASVALLLCGVGLMVWSMNSEVGWVGIGFISVLFLIIGAALLLWALVWWVSTYVYK